MPVLYNYDSRGIYTGASNAYLDGNATKNTRTRTYLLPVNATLVPVPETALGENECFVFSDGAWAVAYNFIGTRIYNQSEPYDYFEISTLGDIPTGYAVTPVSEI